MSRPAPHPTVPPSGEGWTVVIDMPGPGPRGQGKPVGWLNLNTVSGMHWKKRWPIEVSWRAQAFRALTKHRLPKAPPPTGQIEQVAVQRYRVEVELRFTDATVRDASNYQPTIKKVIDALGPYEIKMVMDRKRGVKRPVEHLGCGLIVADDRRYIEQPEPTIGPKITRRRYPDGRLITPDGQIVLRITPLQPEGPTT